MRFAFAPEPCLFAAFGLALKGLTVGLQQGSGAFDLGLERGGSGTSGDIPNGNEVGGVHRPLENVEGWRQHVAG